MYERKYHWAIVISAPRANSWQSFSGSRYVQACGRRKASALDYNAAAFVAAVKKIVIGTAPTAPVPLAKESTTEPVNTAWPKLKPIADAPTDGTFVLAHWSVHEYPRLRGLRWAIVRIGTGLVWCTENGEPLSEPTHFLPLPPEVEKFSEGGCK